MSAPNLVRVTESQWRAFATLRLRALEDTLGCDDSQFRQEVSFTAAHWRRRLRTHAQFAAMIDDRMVGLIGAQREKADSVYLYSLWLEPAVRHRGLARELLAAAVEWARRERVSAVTLRVDTGNDAARRVYESQGFTVDPDATRRHDDEVTMRLVVR
jgi:ribosomal protein S18 acetylase RimI-like enzyme